MSDPREFCGGPLDGQLMAVPGNPYEYHIKVATVTNTEIKMEKHLYLLERLGFRYDYARLIQSEEA